MAGFGGGVRLEEEEEEEEEVEVEKQEEEEETMSLIHFRSVRLGHGFPIVGKNGLSAPVI